MRAGGAVIPVDALRPGGEPFAGAGRARHAPAQSCQTRRTALTAAAPGDCFL